MKLIFLFLVGIFVSFSCAFADVVYPIGGPVSSKNTDKAEFINFSCSTPDTKKRQVNCRQTLTTIKPKLESLVSIEELEAIAKRDNFDVNLLKQMCKKMSPFFAFVDGETLEGRTIEKKQLEKLEEQSAAMGFEKNMFSTVREICDSPSERGIIKMLDEMQRAERRVCKVNSFTSSERAYKLDIETGTFIASEVINGLCDQYVYTEVLTLDDFGLGVINKYEEKRTFIQELKRNKDRERLLCDDDDKYGDKVFTQDIIYFPLNCVSFVRD